MPPAMQGYRWAQQCGDETLPEGLACADDAGVQVGTAVWGRDAA